MSLISEKLKLLTTSPGCYLMKNIDGKIIYVGKAKNLKRRVSSYFNKEHIGKTKALVENIYDFEYIVTESEVESLLLEINLIKKYSPKYNIMLKDNKSYPYIEITNEKIPRLIISRPRNIKLKKSKLFGPYPNSGAARNVVNMLNRLYPLRKCHTMEKNVCLYYHIGQCLGYCEKKIDKLVIDNMINEITKFLKGNFDDVKKRIKDEMIRASNNLNYELAIEYKEMLAFIDKVLEKQKIDLNDNISRDIINYCTKNDYLSIQIIHIKNGMIISRDSDIFTCVDDITDTIIYYVTAYYEKHDIPKEIFLPQQDDFEVLKNVLNTSIIIPQKGIKKKLVNMAYENAKITLEEKFELILRDEKRTFLANEELGKLLGINNLSRIEVFDNAHLFGTYTVSGMVVFTNGKPDKKEYRKYKINSNSHDDYHTMKEVIYRRYYRILSDGLVKPDLILVDGGIIEINAAKDVLKSLYINIPVLGIKKNNKHEFTKLVSDKKEYDIDKTSDLFHYLTRISDEVHRFTIAYHKDIRSKGSLSSILDNISGIGEKRKKALLKKYKTITKLKSLSLDELKCDLPDLVAERLFDFLANYK